MQSRRVKPKRARRAFGLTISMLILVPTSIGLQDPASAIARQSNNAERMRQHLMASPFGTIQAAAFSLPRPVGSVIPLAGYQLAGLDLNEVDILPGYNSQTAWSVNPATGVGSCAISCHGYNHITLNKFYTP